VDDEETVEVCVMQSADTVLDVLRDRGARGLPLERLYRQLFNEQLFLAARHAVAPPESRDAGKARTSGSGSSHAETTLRGTAPRG
jgi:hypothetical protein